MWLIYEYVVKIYAIIYLCIHIRHIIQCVNINILILNDKYSGTAFAYEGASE